MHKWHCKKHGLKPCGARAENHQSAKLAIITQPNGNYSIADKRRVSSLHEDHLTQKSSEAVKKQLLLRKITMKLLHVKFFLSQTGVMSYFGGATWFIFWQFLTDKERHAWFTLQAFCHLL